MRRLLHAALSAVGAALVFTGSLLFGAALRHTTPRPPPWFGEADRREDPPASPPPPRPDDIPRWEVHVLGAGVVIVHDRQTTEAHLAKFTRHFELLGWPEAAPLHLREAVEAELIRVAAAQGGHEA